jgi:hypothetical protein
MVFYAQLGEATSRRQNFPVLLGLLITLSRLGIGATLLMVPRNVRLPSESGWALCQWFGTIYTGGEDTSYNSILILRALKFWHRIWTAMEELMCTLPSYAMKI